MKPVDMVVAVRLVTIARFGTTYAGLADDLGISASEAHASSKRLVEARLFKAQERRTPFPRWHALLEFWVHGLKYVYPAELGRVTRGIPTSVGAAPLNQEFQLPDNMIPVWPDAKGTVRGPALKPIHPSAVRAAQDERVYELLSLLDALREGKAREQQLAEQFLRERLYIGP